MECVILRGEPPDWAASRSGYGSGYGYGDGYGSGDGYGYGDGYGDAQYWTSTVQYFAKKWSEAQRQRLNQLREAGAKIAFWRSDENGYACNGGRRTKPAEPGLVEKIPGPLKVCTKNALHATQLPPKWKGERVWCVALIGEIQQDEDKLGALEREIIGECL